MLWRNLTVIPEMLTIYPNSYLLSAKHWQLWWALWESKTICCKSRGQPCRLVLCTKLPGHVHTFIDIALLWRHNDRDGVSNHQPHLVFSTVYTGADQIKHQSSASLAFVWEIHRSPVNSPHKWPVTQKMFPFDDVTMVLSLWFSIVKPSLKLGHVWLITLQTFTWMWLLALALI